jgi:2-succinyl-5-enolpyruvyl-6-hydroxy-3-cyclohexene-1-carboxylate synthase
MNHPAVPHGPGADNLAFARALVAELQAAGVQAAVMCPGSRSTPLALAIAGQRGLRYSMHVDERSAAFHALGCAKASGRPVALLCTSGTAGANFVPAVAEASHARVPLIVLTADRPPELRAWGAAQTMEQRTLFAGFARWMEEAPCPSESGANESYARALGRRAVAEATGPAPGPVHLNLPFREPLVPASIEMASRTAATPVERARPVISTRDVTGALAGQLRAVERGVLLFGPEACDGTPLTAVARLATALGWPVLADPASGLRAGDALEGSIVHGADLLLREAKTAAALAPQLVLRFGGLPTSKAIATWLAGHVDADFWLIDPAGAFRDPHHHATRVLRSDVTQLAAMLEGIAQPSAATLAWRGRWLRTGRKALTTVDEFLSRDARLLGPQLARSMWSALPADAVLYVANSMPIRELDSFAGSREAPLRVLANRGVNGIDGQVSCALGAAAALDGPVVLWCGDLALMHDLSGLLAGRLHDADLTIVVSNDDGGGIFEYLPVAQSLPREIFEPMFAVPHGLDLSALAGSLGWNSTRVGSAAAFEAALAASLRGGRHVIEVPMDRAENTALHLELYEAVRAPLRRELA